MQAHNLIRTSTIGLLAMCAGILVFLHSTPADAQDVRLGLRVFKQKAECGLCHGWAGDGDYAMDHPGPPIRTAELSRDALVETIRCGRPGTNMPFHFRLAYTENPETSCYGLTEAEIGDEKPNPTRAFLTEREIEAVADYVIAWIFGRGDPTVEECEFYFGEGHATCRRYAE